ncbi:MAG: alpha/beta hydrolase [Gammaproteobacteria bacterium]|nr:alpha/beta hydrolase [Gammaproteobacteria bacterium]
MKRSLLFPYDSGFTPWMASRMDRRFSLSLYVPESMPYKGESRLLLLVHGTSRVDWMRRCFQEFSERTGTVLMAPLFPVGASDERDVHGYKWIHTHGVRYDLLLLDMIDQAASTWNFAKDKFSLFGFSGGGQFANRFLYLHPKRLSALSICAPGNVTLPDPELPWPAGVKGLKELFGISFDSKAVHAVPTHMAIGDADTETWEIAKSPDDPVYISRVNDLHTNRIVRLQRLRDELRNRGSATLLEFVEGVAHEGPDLAPAVIRWMENNAVERTSVSVGRNHRYD